MPAARALREWGGAKPSSNQKYVTPMKYHGNLPCVMPLEGQDGAGRSGGECRLSPVARQLLRHGAVAEEVMVKKNAFAGAWAERREFASA